MREPWPWRLANSQSKWLGWEAGDGERDWLEAHDVGPAIEELPEYEDGHVPHRRPRRPTSEWDGDLLEQVVWTIPEFLAEERGPALVPTCPHRHLDPAIFMTDGDLRIHHRSAHPGCGGGCGKPDLG